MAANGLTFEDWPWQVWCSRQPDKTALIADGETISWRRLVNDILRVPDLSSAKSSYVAITACNDYRTLIVLLAAWQQGVKTLLLNPAFSNEQRQEILNQAGVHSVIEPESVPLNVSAKSCLDCQPFSAGEPLTLVLTSGSTGTPKAVAHAASHHLASANGLFAMMPFERKDCWLLSLPLFHVSGLAIVWRWLAKGAVLKIANTKGEALHQSLDDVTHASLVPTQLQRLLQGNVPKTLRAVLLGGSTIPQQLVNDAEGKGIACWCGYGMTEMASTITAKRADGRFSVGTTLPNRELTVSEQGEVWVRGETLAMGYLINGAITPLADAWFATKDKGEWRDGELVILGRMDNMFVCGGENVQPEAVERVLATYDGVEQVFVLPVADDKWGHVPVALVEGSISYEAFRQWAGMQLAPYQIPRRVYGLPSSMSNGGIKVSRKALADWLQSQI